MSTGIGNRRGDGGKVTPGSSATPPEPGDREEVLETVQIAMDDEMLQTVMIPSPTAGEGTPVAGNKDSREEPRGARQPERQAELSPETEAAQRCEDILLETVMADLSRLRRRGAGSRHGGDP